MPQIRERKLGSREIYCTLCYHQNVLEFHEKIQLRQRSRCEHTIEISIKLSPFHLKNSIYVFGEKESHSYARFRVSSTLHRVNEICQCIASGSMHNKPSINYDQIFLFQVALIIHVCTKCILIKIPLLIVVISQK